MKYKKNRLLILCALILLSNVIRSQIVFYGDKNNDLSRLLEKEGVELIYVSSMDEAIKKASKKIGILAVADKYPDMQLKITASDYDMIKKKGARMYVEYPSFIPDQPSMPKPIKGKLERAVVTSPSFGTQLPEMSVLGINDCTVFPVKVDKTLLVLAKVAGFDKAEYGLADTDVYPLLYRRDNVMIATTCLSNFYTARYAPNKSWRIVWESVLKWVTSDKVNQLTCWSSDPRPMYMQGQELPSTARIKAVEKGSEWFFNARLLIHPSWKEHWLTYQGDGTSPFGPPIGFDKRIGNGNFGILEGHASTIYSDGTQQYRYWDRTDVQGEVAFALAASGNLLKERKYSEVSENLIDYIFYTSKDRGDSRNNKNSATYGLLGWANTHQHVFYNDDNARAILGVIGASALMNEERWNTYIVENILANFRTSSKQGFQGSRLEEKNIESNGWEYYFNRDFENPHPHFESWMWACYLWLYDKTGYEPLLTKARDAIRITMNAYPDKWKWTNGIQQERARMILPLAWLVRVDDTEEHRKWLSQVVDKLLESQQSNGAIREELGGGKGQYGPTKTNQAYGKHEAPLIFRNGDPVADMLYTSNFAFFALNEAAQTTGNKRYQDAVSKLADFLVRIQVKSDSHPDLDGAWFRAFDYNRWDYWASNADAGWGAWCTLSGWIQSWIVGTQALVEKNQSYWNITQAMDLKKSFELSRWMLEPAKGSKLIQNLKNGEKQTLVIYGTSISSNEIGRVWVKALEEKIKSNYGDSIDVFNVGQSGQHSQWALEHLEERVLKHRPNTVILEFTANDAVERFSITPEQCRLNTERIIKQIRTAVPGCEIILHTPCLAPQHPELNATPRPRMALYNAVYKDLALKYDITLIDETAIFKSLLDEKGISAFKKIVYDGVHPTKEGALSIIFPNVMQSLLTGKSSY